MIPEAAVEAALSALFPDKAISDFTRAVQEPSIRTILEAAAPHMLAEAWDAGWYERAQYDGAQRIPEGDEENPHRTAK